MNDAITPTEPIMPGEIIRDELEERGWTQADLAKIMGRVTNHVNQIITGKTSITPQTAIDLSEAFDTTPELWMNLEAAYRLSLAQKSGGHIRKRAALYENSPVKEMEKRGWIKETHYVDGLESELKRFYKTDSLETPPRLPVAARTSAAPTEHIAPAQIAWCYRILSLAPTIKAAAFSDNGLTEAIKRLCVLATHPENARLVPRVLADAGVRFVIVEHLTHTKIDGVAMWLDDSSPVVALSLRYDRIDYFWHSLIHELIHVKYRHNYLLDVDMFGGSSSFSEERSAIERQTDAEAAASLVSREKLESFIRRVAPLYSKQRIAQFANLNKVHPGIVAGQLQFRGEISYNANREMLVKVRRIITAEALTDGWGFSIQI